MPKRPAASAAPESRPVPPEASAAFPLLLVAATFAAFWPSLGNGFVNWDDGANFLENFGYRGLGWEQLRWMWTTFHMGHYQPLSWMTLGLDYSVWGLDPFGYHLTSLILHAANAVLFYFVALRLLRRAPAALLAALVFAVHPLRVESVAWATERRDVLSGFFYLATLWFYLESRLAPALACFLLSLLSKASGITLPLALLVLDVYPLRRLPADLARWLEPPSRAVLKEKMIFAAIALPFAALAFLAQSHTGVISRFASMGLAERLELAAYGAVFYVWKSAAPFHLLPLYARPAVFDVWAPRFLASAAAALAGGCFLLAARKRLPALLAAGAFYLITLAPVMGLVPAGIYLAADRYSYLSCLGWAVLAGLAAESARQRLGQAGRTVLTFALAAAVGCLCLLTRAQCRVWRDSAALWSYTLSLDPDSAPARNNLGTALARSGREADAAVEFERAIALDPGYAEARNNLATARVHQGRLDEAVADYRRALEADPSYAMARDNLGAALAEQGKTGEAIAEYRRALDLNPADAHAHDNLGAVLAGEGQLDEAAAEFRRALAANPHYAAAAEHLRQVSSAR